jgi:hypothetical protein
MGDENSESNADNDDVVVAADDSHAHFFQITNVAGKNVHPIKNLSWFAGNHDLFAKLFCFYPIAFRFFGNQWVLNPRDLCHFLRVHRYTSRYGSKTGHF